MSKKNGPSYLRRKERRAQERKEKREAKTLHETEIIDRKNDFKTRLVVALQKPARIERPEEKIDIERLDIDHNFANKIKIKCKLLFAFFYYFNNLFNTLI